jgi:hypothetical protein
MKLIYALKDTAYGNSDQKAVKDDKWNPGDIWAIDSTLNINKSLNAENIVSYNKALLQSFVDRKVVGISLKLVKKTAKSKEYNVQLPPDTDDHKITSIIFQGETRGTFWGNKGATVIFDSGKLDLRAGSAGGAIKGEIRLKTARGGGAGYGIMVDAIKAVLGKRLPDNKSINRIAKNIVKGNKRSIKVMYTLYNHFYKNDSLEDFEAEIKKKDAIWIHSKLACLFVLFRVDEQAGTKANRWITKVVNYAGSKSEDSSVYVKVYQ